MSDRLAGTSIPVEAYWSLSLDLLPYYDGQWTPQNFRKSTFIYQGARIQGVEPACLALCPFRPTIELSLDQE